jgi:hypothetical protein
VPALIVTTDGSETVAKAARAAGIELKRKPLRPAQLRAAGASLGLIASPPKTRAEDRTTRKISALSP